MKLWVGELGQPDRSLEEVLEEQNAAPPKEPAEASLYFVHALATRFIEREAGPDRARQVCRDFVDASTALISAAADGATWGEQKEILRKVWEDFDLPEQDLRKRRTPRPIRSDDDLLKVYDELLSQLNFIDSNPTTNREGNGKIEAIRRLAPSASEDALRNAAAATPTVATQILLANLHDQEPDTIRNRISRARKKAR